MTVISGLPAVIIMNIEEIFCDLSPQNKNQFVTFYLRYNRSVHLSWVATARRALQLFSAFPTVLNALSGVLFVSLRWARMTW